MADLQEIQDSYRKYVIAPITKFGLGGFVFDIEGEITAEQTAEITEHFVEDNSFVQDHIAIRPEVITLNSRIGENIFEDGTIAENIVEKVAQKLITLEEYLPKVTAAYEQAKALSKEDFVDFSDDLLDAADDIWSLTKALNPAADRQQQAYLYFKALHEKRITVSVQTPFGYMQDMAIETITAVQGAETAFMSDFSITLKRIRTVSTQTVAFDSSRYQSEGADQIASEQDNGTTNGTKSILAASLDGFTGVK